MTHDHKPLRAGIYVRVSKSNGTQTVDNQLLKLRELARARGLDAVVFEDQRSAVKHRPGFEAMLNAARGGEIPGGVLVAALDRMGRSMIGVVQTVLELDRLKVPVISLREPWLDMGGPARSLLISIFGWVAEEERRILIERTHDGLDRARAEGKQLGRRAVELPIAEIAEIQKQRQKGVPWSRLAAQFDVSEMTLRRRLAAPAP